MKSKLYVVVRNNHSWLAAALDPRRQLPCHPLARDRGVRNRAQALVGHVVSDAEDSEPPVIGHLVVHEIERPASIGPGFHQDGEP